MGASEHLILSSLKRRIFFFMLELLENQRLFPRMVKYPLRSKGMQINGRMVKGSREANTTTINIASEQSHYQQCAYRRVHQAVPRKSCNVNEILLLAIKANERICIRRHA